MLLPPAVVTTPHVMPLPPLVLSVLRRLLSADDSPPFCHLYASPPICLLFASWLSCHPCCRAAADSTLQLCLNLFFPIWLLQLAMPHLLRRRRLLSSSHLCLAMRHLRLLTHRRITTGCVVAAIVDAQMLLPSMRRRLCRYGDCDCRPWRLLPSSLVIELVLLSSSSLSSSSYPITPLPSWLTLSPAAP